MRKFSLLLVDDHPIVSLGVETLLKDAEDFECLGAVTNAFDALAQVERLQPDLVVLDLMLGGRDGLELIADLLKAAPAVRVVIFSAMDEKIHARRAFGKGARGYVTKDAGFLGLLKAIRSVAAGESYASDFVKQAILEETVGRKGGVPAFGIGRLSNQELCVFRLLGSGLGSAEVALKLGISPKTVSTHRERIKNKLGIQTARELERHAERFFRAGESGLATGEEPSF